MHLGKKLKINMIIAILLCMAFVVNLGTTFASVNYKFYTSSVHTVDNGKTTYDNYVDFGSAQGTSGKYTYSPGTVNNQLAINYSFKEAHDLMIKFKATYSNTSYYQTTTDSNGDLLTTRTHIANDFSLNIASRDNWIVDMGSIVDWIAAKDNPTYYTTASSNTSTITGVMYYMKSVTGAGSLPVISGVDFHTSINNSYEFIGDTLTITLEPVYVKADAENYNANHKFCSTTVSGFTPNTTLLNNWIAYMDEKGDGTTASSSKVMIYNSYVDYNRALEFPYDDLVLERDQSGNVVGELDPNASKPTYSNTAYQYSVDETRSYHMITAGNKYYGGLGAHVIPDGNTVTISVIAKAFWCKQDGTLLGTTQSGVVEFEYADEIQKITNGDTSYYYYRKQITKPTYINILDSIRLTSEISSNLILNNYRLVLGDITVNIETDKDSIVKPGVGQESETNTAWNANASVPTYEIHNSTLFAPVLARVTEVYNGEKTYDANVSVTNNEEEPLAISSFKISTDLWYGEYSVQVSNGSTVKTFHKTALGNGYLAKDREVFGKTVNNLIFDETMWEISNYSNGVFTFTNIGGVAYIPGGYTMTLISGVTIPTTPECQSEDDANDFWCSLDVEITTEEDAVYTATTSNGVEVVVEGYYNTISSADKPGKIYIKNNTCQEITGVTLSNLSVSKVVPNGDFLARESRGDELGDTEYTLINHLQTEGAISIKPNEMVLAYTILPNKVVVGQNQLDVTAIIDNFNISVTLDDKQLSDDVYLLYNVNTKEYNSNTKLFESKQLGIIANSSSTCYEFRLVSDTQITDKLIDDDKFMEHQVGGTYYYYYIGILCPGQSINVFNDFITNVTIEAVVHDEKTGIARYMYLTGEDLDETKIQKIVKTFGVNNGVNNWSITANDIATQSNGEITEQWFATWLKAMQDLYDDPTDIERENATIITKS